MSSVMMESTAVNFGCVCVCVPDLLEWGGRQSYNLVLSCHAHAMSHVDIVSRGIIVHLLQATLYALSIHMHLLHKDEKKGPVDACRLHHDHQEKPVIFRAKMIL